MKESPTRWQELDIEHLFYAYRKAKIDCFNDRNTGAIAERFVAYEQNLCANLNTLRNALQQGQIVELLLNNLGQARLIAKTLRISQPEGVNVHTYYSSSVRAFEALLKQRQAEPEFRLMGDFPVDMYVLSALWINEVGHKFDKALSPNAYAMRLRRHQSSGDLAGTNSGKYHRASMGSFAPYFPAYNAWRANAFDAIRNELENDRPVIAMSLDLSSYYHNIDPSFMASPEFWRELGLELNDWEASFTIAFTNALKEWGNRVIAQLKNHTGTAELPEYGGLPIGLSAAHLMANVLLWKLDKIIAANLDPVYYGRFVDDIILVIRDPENQEIVDAQSVMNHIKQRLPTLCDTLSLSENTVEPKIRCFDFGEAYQARSRLILQDRKHKVFFLNGEGGIDLINNIEREIGKLAKERKTLPDLNAIEKILASKALTAASDTMEEAVTLRRAEGLSVKRAGWSIQLTNIETLARTMRPSEWLTQRQSFYTFVRHHILRADRILDNFDYVRRLVSLAVSLEDWSAALDLVKSSLQALQRLSVLSKQAKVNGITVSKCIDELWASMQTDLLSLCREAILCAIPIKNGIPATLDDNAKSLLQLVDLRLSDDFGRRIIELHEHDWAKISYAAYRRLNELAPRRVDDGEHEIAACYEYLEELKTFLRVRNRLIINRHGLQGTKDVAKIRGESLYPYLFATRPHTGQDIERLLPEGASNDALWSKSVLALRGSRVM